MFVDLRPISSAIGQGNLKLAHQLCEQALVVDSVNPEAISLMGIIAGRMGRHDIAAKMMHDALSLRPDDQHYRCNYVTALLSLDRLSEAEATVNEGLARNPKHIGLLSLNGVISGRLGKLDTALDSLQKAAESQPKNPQILYNLGEIHRRLGNTEGASEAFQNCLSIDSNHSDALNNMAGMLLGQGDFIDSLRYIERHLKASPRSSQGYCNLSVAMQAAGDVPQAIVSLSNALKLDPSLDDARFRLINLLIAGGEFEEAEAELSRWQKKEPSNSRLLAVQARMMERQGRLTEARESLSKIAKDDRDAIPVMMTEAILLDAENKADMAAEVLDKLIESKPEAMDQIGIRFLYGKCKDSLSDFDSAFEHYQAGNDLRRKGFGNPFQAEGSRLACDTAIKLNSDAWNELVKPAGCDSAAPIFIVGMPRSGSSLTEQILGLHPDVYPAGELQLMSQQIQQTNESVEENSSKRGFEIVNPESDGSRVPMWPANVNPDVLKTIGRGYIDGISELSKGERFVTDKMPYNYLFLPLINMALPNAKIIHVRRDPIDTCLSCYFQNFTGGSEFAFDLEDLAVYFQNYARMMECWRSDLKVPMLEIDYEILVSDSESQIRSMLDYCDLEWDPNCLKSHQSNRVVATASYQQVRQPIYTKSVSRWKNYEAHLEPLIKGLGDLANTAR